MRALVLGVGRMGTAIAYAMDKLGFHVTGMDTNRDAVNSMPFKVNHEQSYNEEGELVAAPERGHFLVVDDPDDIIKGLTVLNKFDIVISSLPYHQTEKVALWCIDNAVRYCDLGGRVDVSQNINKAAKEKATFPVFTDLGLAPGLVNILAEEGCRELHNKAESVNMMVGGLPEYHESVNNPLRYGVTWSVDGLINEYKDDCLILENGEIKTVRGMDGLENLETEKLGKLEAFYTSGGASHSIHSMKERGVKNCSYKTLRYRGHGKIIKFLIRDCCLSDEIMAKIFEQGCGHAEKDEVIVLAEVRGGNKTWRKEILVKSDDKFSAMQKATAFSISSVAAIMAEGKMEGNKEQHRDYHTQYDKSLGYKDVPFDEFNKNLNKLGLDI
tara:strand:- start:16373 stop:17524 length:1152 start_codon:yes stop_codon:yes gene_type:complete